MPFPTDGWPPRRASTRPSLRFYVTGTATGNFSDNAFLFIDDAGANPYTPLPVVRPGSSDAVHVGPPPYGTGRAAGDANLSMADETAGAPANINLRQSLPKAAIFAEYIRIINDGSAILEYSFGATANSGSDAVVQGRVLIGGDVTLRNRHECGITVRGTGSFSVEAW